MRNLKLIFLRMYGPLAQRLLFSPWFVGSLVYQAALAPVGLNLVASDFHAENKQRKQNRDNMALLSSSTRFGFSVQLLDLSVCKWICMSLKGFHYQVSILDLHRMATECWTTCSRLARKYTDSLAPPFPPVHVVAEKRGVMARFIVEINCLKTIRLSFSCCACVSPLLFLFFFILFFSSGRRLERVEQVVSMWRRLFDVEEQRVHPALTWHRGQRLPGAWSPVSQLYQRAVSTEWVHHHPRTTR